MSSKRRVRRKQCGKKLRHTQKSHAYAELRSRSPRVQKELVVYSCKWCNGYHVGHRKNGAWRYLVVERDQ